jgi:hypothetical protein
MPKGGPEPMKIPSEIIAPLLAIFMTAQVRGWIDLQTLRPLLKTIVEHGYTTNVRQMLGEILELLEAVERGA